VSVIQLPEGVHVFERGWLSSNCILFDDGHTSSLVDSGYCTHSSLTLDLVASKLGSRALNFLINTHLHSDHCGGNAALQARYTDLVTVIPPGQSPLVKIWDPVGLFYTPTGQLCPQFKFDEILKNDSAIQMGLQEWEVHAAGGHDPHAMIFFEPKAKVLISADALWQSGFGVIFPELEGIEAFGEVAATLDLIERLNPEVVIPGHGSIFKYTPEILATARQKLEGFVKDPRKLARHGAKVLLKFKLLEKQKLMFSEFSQWAADTPCLVQYQRQFFNESDFPTWIEKLCLELVKAGVAKWDGDEIFNQ
jgi:glyoxylase-like metal-dependent hydrolase (beta-lactamase superfamily II)